MANIALLNYCNLSCPYCFANKYIDDTEKQLITMEQLDRILNFLSKSQIERVGLIGGEPTLHPHFKEILLHVIDFAAKQHLSHDPLVFSNGIELEKYAQYFVKARVLLNLNEPKVVGEKNWNKIEHTLYKLHQLGATEENVYFGINLYPQIKDFSYIFKLANQYGIDIIRCSYTAPTCQFTTPEEEKENYYNQGKDLFLRFVETAAKNQIKINMDCNKIPLCYFEQDDQNFILEWCENYTSYCEPVLDITPDFKAVSCFGTYDIIDLADFENFEQAARYCQFKTMYPRTERNYIGKCVDCPKAKNLSCQGGCLSFTRNKT